MKVLVGHVFRVQAYPPLTNSTGMCEILFVTRNATRMFICQDVSATGETLVTRNADKMLGMKIFPKGLGVLTSEYQLVASTASRLQVFRVMTLTL